jgi:hypothetical protein
MAELSKTAVTSWLLIDRSSGRRGVAAGAGVGHAPNGQILVVIGKAKGLAIGAHDLPKRGHGQHFTGEVVCQGGGDRPHSRISTTGSVTLLAL